MFENSTGKRHFSAKDDDAVQHGRQPPKLMKHQHDGWSPSGPAIGSPSSPLSFNEGPSFDATTKYSQNISMDLETLSREPQLQSSASNLPYLQVPSRSGMIGQRSPKFHHCVEEEICFGMLRRAEIKLISTQREDSDVVDRVESEKEEFVLLDLSFGQDRCDVQFCSRNIASLQTKTKHALQSLISMPDAKIRFEALVPRLDLRQKLQSAMRPFGIDKTGLSWAMNIHVFGVRTSNDVVAKTLSKHQLFLQHPEPIRSDIAYENPQYLNMAGSSFINGAVLRPIAIATTAPELDLESAPVEVDNVLDEVKAVINQYSNNGTLREAVIDARVTTDLLSHQKIGVDFVLGRESAKDEVPTILWALEQSPSNNSIFRHKITGTKSRKADDILGGILADDMGLGKTLTMISAIVATLKLAAEFAAENKLSNTNESRRKTPANATLVILPSVLLLKGWIAEIAKHVSKDVLKWHIYHGDQRLLSSSSRSLPYHIVFTTYGTVTADFKKGGGMLANFHWFRIILDEAHTIRNWTTKSFESITSLSANIRWRMTGTPVQNSLNDLRSLVEFLRVPQLKDRPSFQKHIAEKSARSKTNQTSKPNFENLKLLLGALCLRRSLASLSLDLGVTFSIEQPQFSKSERTAYDKLERACRVAIDIAVNERQGKGGNRAILTALLRLRIFCNTGVQSPDIGKEDDSIADFEPDEISSLLQQSGDVPICTECNREVTSFDTVRISVQQLNSSEGSLKCQECRSDATSTAVNPSGLNDNQGIGSEAQITPQPALRGNDHDVSIGIADDLQPSTYPTKLRAVLSNITIHHPEEKSIVFSFWKRSLDLLAKLLHDNNIVFGQVDGTLPPERRQTVLENFSKDPTIKILLMTLGTGAQGINNLSVATRVHILEPQWNPSVEEQAIGRVLRLGQDKKVTVFRYVMQRTIEESVATRQLVKIELALAGGLRSTNAKKLSEDERKVRLQEFSELIPPLAAGAVSEADVEESVEMMEF